MGFWQKTLNQAPHKNFISDMNESYRTVHNTFFKESIYIVDHFHVVKLFTEAIQIIRTRIMKSQDKDSRSYKYLKKNWKLFLMNKFNLKDHTFVNSRTGVVYNTLDSIDMVLKTYPELFEVYWAKDEFVSYMLKFT